VSPQSRPTVRVCSVTDAVNAVGDRYSLPIVREIFYGNNRFSQLAALVGAPRTLLSGRLRRLEELGIVQRHQYSEHPPRDDFRLTDAGRELFPVLIALKEWGDRHGGMDRPSARLGFSHHCGRPLETELVCASCREVVRFEDLVVTGRVRPTPATGAKKKKRAPKAQRSTG
jgi:DNA-binding HxlR family transcriptional regulator